MAVFPNALVTSALTNFTNVVGSALRNIVPSLSTRLNALRDEVVAIEATLGIDPHISVDATVNADVSERIDVLETLAAVPLAAGNVFFFPGGTISSTDVQNAIVEVAEEAAIATNLTSGQVPLAVLGSGTPAAGKYVDGASGVWTTLPGGGGTASPYPFVVCANDSTAEWQAVANYACSGTAATGGDNVQINQALSDATAAGTVPGSVMLAPGNYWVTPTSINSVLQGVRMYTDSELFCPQTFGAKIAMKNGYVTGKYGIIGYNSSVTQIAVLSSDQSNAAGIEENITLRNLVIDGSANNQGQVVNITTTSGLTAVTFTSGDLTQSDNMSELFNNANIEHGTVFTYTGATTGTLSQAADGTGTVATNVLSMFDSFPTIWLQGIRGLRLEHVRGINARGTASNTATSRTASITTVAGSSAITFASGQMLSGDDGDGIGQSTSDTNIWRGTTFTWTGSATSGTITPAARTSGTITVNVYNQAPGSNGLNIEKWNFQIGHCLDVTANNCESYSEDVLPVLWGGRGISTGFGSTGFATQYCNQVRVHNLTGMFHRYNGAGCHGSTDVLYTNSRFFGNTNSGYLVEKAHNVRFTNCDFGLYYGTFTASTWAANGESFGNGSQGFYADAGSDVQLTNCTSFGNGGDGFGFGNPVAWSTTSGSHALPTGTVTVISTAGANTNAAGGTAFGSTGTAYVRNSNGDMTSFDYTGKTTTTFTGCTGGTGTIASGSVIADDYLEGGRLSGTVTGCIARNNVGKGFNFVNDSSCLIRMTACIAENNGSSMNIPTATGPGVGTFSWSNKHGGVITSSGLMTVPASGTSQPSPYPMNCSFTLDGGIITSVTLDGATTPVTTQFPGTLQVSPGTPIVLTYTTPTKTGIVSSVANSYFVLVGHGMPNNTKIVTSIMGTTTTPAAGTYYVVNATANTFQVSATKGGIPITFAGTDSAGIQAVVQAVTWQWVME